MPLVIHARIGVPEDHRRALSRTSHICKFNIGTKLHMSFGRAPRAAVMADRYRFDRSVMARETHDPVMAVTHRVNQVFGAAGQR